MEKLRDLNIRRFVNGDLEAAGDLALEMWGDEVPEIPAEFRPALYQFLVRYYYYADSPWNFAAYDGGTLCGILLANPKQLRSQAAEKWAEERIPAKFRELFRAYLAYLDGNRKKEHAVCQENEVILSLFASRRKGCGGRLMNAFSAGCAAAGLSSAVLWTDDTCDFQYYYHNHFEEIGRQPTNPPLFAHRTTTYLFRKHFTREAGIHDNARFAGGA